jgi:hypothetical protein
MYVGRRSGRSSSGGHAGLDDHALLKLSCDQAPSRGASAALPEWNTDAAVDGSAERKGFYVMYGWMSPNFGPIGCLGAFLFWLVIVAAVFALLYLPWSLVIHHQ